MRKSYEGGHILYTALGQDAAPDIMIRCASAADRMTWCDSATLASEPPDRYLKIRTEMTCRQDNRGRAATCRNAMSGDAVTAAGVIWNSD